VTQTTQSNPTAAGPTAGTPHHKNGDGSDGRPLRLSVIALVVSILSIGLSVLALIAAGSNDSATPVPQQTTEAASAPSTLPAESTARTETAFAPEENTSPRASDAPLPTASANYTISYEDRRLTLLAGGRNCTGARQIDLDQPAINVSSGDDLQYVPISGCDGAPSLRFASDKVATVVSLTATPQDCAQQIQLSPASQEITPSQDQVICVVTDGQGDPNQPERAKIARIVVTGVGQEQKVALTVTAWEIPY
jgi:hypothetical protein